FDPDGTVHPATVIKAGPCVVVQAKTAQTDGYEAVQLGLVEETPAKANKPTLGHFKKANLPPTRVQREVNVAAGGNGGVKPGDQLSRRAHSRRDQADQGGAGRKTEGGEEVVHCVPRRTRRTRRRDPVIVRIDPPRPLRPPR